MTKIGWQSDLGGKMKPNLSPLGKGVKKERPGPDHVIPGPMRGIKQLHPMAQTNRQRDKHGNSVTNRLYYNFLGDSKFRRTSKSH